MPGNQPIQSIGRAIQALFAVAGAEGGQSAAEIAKAMGVPRATAYRIIQTLEREGVLTRSKHPIRFHLGPAIEELSHLDKQRDLLTTASRVLFRAHARFVRSELFLIEFLGCQAHVRLRCGGSYTTPASRLRRYVNAAPYDRASSILFLAYASANDAALFFEQYPFHPAGEAIWKSRSALDATLSKVRHDHYAAIPFSSDPSGFRVAAPVFNHLRQLIAAVSGRLSITDPEADRQRLITLCIHAAHDITSQVTRARAVTTSRTPQRRDVEKIPGPALRSSQN